jgi:hypothetical protein
MKFCDNLILALQHPATPVKLTPGLIVAVVLGWLVLVVLLVGFSLSRLRRDRSIVRGALERAGYEVLQMDYRYLRLGAFSLWNTSRSQSVFRVLVRDRSTAAQLTVWARCGRSWLTSPEQLEFRCDDTAAAARLNASGATGAR